MKRALYSVKNRLIGKSKQDQLIDFVSDKKNIEKAVEGSMQKRIDLIDRVELKNKHA